MNVNIYNLFIKANKQFEEREREGFRILGGGDTYHNQIGNILDTAMHIHYVMHTFQ
jgi:hypothetical protein